MTDDLKQRLRAVCETGCDPDLPFEAAERIEQLEKERDELLADAARYRFIREQPLDASYPEGWYVIEVIVKGGVELAPARNKEHLDSAIDAAITKLKGRS